MSGSVRHALDNLEDNDWHSLIFFYQDKAVYIMDPDYTKENKEKRLQNIKGLHLAKELVSLIERNQKEEVQGTLGWGRSVDKVYYGSPKPRVQQENLGCNKVTRLWIERWVQEGCNVDWFSQFREISYR